MHKKKLFEAINVYKKNPDNDIYQDALIQHFEFAFELSWKAIKEFMISNGLKNDLVFPKEILKVAFQFKIIDNEKVWFEMLTARNLTSHVYDKNTASEISQNIFKKFWCELKKLVSKLDF